MIDTIAKRRMTFNGTTYKKGDIVPMPLPQFAEIGPDGIAWVERAPAAKSPEPKSSGKPAD